MDSAGEKSRRSPLPDITIESLARGFFREAERYGFDQVDHIRFVNRLLDMAMGANGSVERAGPAPLAGPAPARDITLPACDDTVCVRAFDPDQDTERFERWLEDPLGRYFLMARSMSGMLRFEDIASDPGSIIGVVTLADGRPIGSMAFLDVDREQGKAELRKLIGDPEARGRGYAKAASRLWVDYGLYGLGLRKIYLQTLDTDLRNIRLNEDLGFRMEGILHDEVLVEGRYRDILRMALWKDGAPGGAQDAVGRDADAEAVHHES